MPLPRRNTPDTSWGPVARWYDEYLATADTYQEKVVLPNLLRQLGDVKGKKVLDLACGPGFFAKHLAVAGAEVTGVDVSPELIERAQKNLLSYPVTKLIVSPAHKLGMLKDKSFDTIIHIFAIDNIAEVGEMLAECARVLKPGGTMHIALNHPVLRIPRASAWGFEQARGVQYRRLDAYMSESRVRIALHPGKVAAGVESASTTTFHRPLQWYVKEFAKAGFAISALEEWISHKQSEAGPRQEAEDKSRKEFPLFLYLQLKR